MAKKIKNKPLRKYQEGGNPFGNIFQGSGLFNPSTSGVNQALFGFGTPTISQGPAQFMNLGDNPFGGQLMSQTQKTANLLGTIPGVQGSFAPLPEWGDAESKKRIDKIIKEKNLRPGSRERFFQSPEAIFRNDAGEEYTQKELEDLAGQEYDKEKAQIAQNQKFAPLITPLIQLNELGEMQKQSYNQAQKEEMYDVTKAPMSMENRGFFAREGMRTPPISQVYRMIGAHQGLPETNYRLLNLKAKKEYQQGGNVNFLDDILYGEDEVESFQNSGQVKKKLSIAERHNNPMSIILTEASASYGAKDSGDRKGQYKWAKFDTPRQGILAALNLFRNDYTNSTLDFALNKYSGGDYDASIVPKIPKDKRVKDLTDEEMLYLIKTVGSKEMPSHLFRKLNKEGMFEYDYEEQQKKNQPLDIRIIDNTVPRVSTYVAPEITASVPNFKAGGNINLRKFLFAEGGEIEQDPPKKRIFIAAINPHIKNDDTFLREAQQAGKLSEAQGVPYEIITAKSQEDWDKKIAPIVEASRGTGTQFGIFGHTYSYGGKMSSIDDIMSKADEVFLGSCSGVACARAFPKTKESTNLITNSGTIYTGVPRFANVKEAFTKFEEKAKGNPNVKDVFISLIYGNNPDYRFKGLAKPGEDYIEWKGYDVDKLTPQEIERLVNLRALSRYRHNQALRGEERSSRLPKGYTISDEERQNILYDLGLSNDTKEAGPRDAPESEIYDATLTIFQAEPSDISQQEINALSRFLDSTIDNPRDFLDEAGVTWEQGNRVLNFLRQGPNYQSSRTGPQLQEIQSTIGRAPLSSTQNKRVNGGFQTLNTNTTTNKKQNNMYYAKNGGNMSLLSSVLRGSLIRGYQEGGMQQPMSEEEAMMMQQAMQEQAMREQAMQQQGMQQQPQPQPQPQQGGEMQQGENRYMQLPREKQVEAYKLIIDFIVDNGIDALEQQYPEEYQFFEEFSDTLEGEEMEQEGVEEGGGEMETEAGRMEMAGPEEEEMQSEYPTDEQEVPLGARPGEGAMREPMGPEQAQQMKQGGIPQRYRNMGFTKVGQKMKSDRPGKRWKVLAKKGDQYKVVHGGDPKMQDYTQHGSEKRKKAFWNRHGGKGSAKAQDPFSPLYWARKGFSNAGPTW